MCASRSIESCRWRTSLQETKSTLPNCVASIEQMACSCKLSSYHALFVEVLSPTEVECSPTSAWNKTSPLSSCQQLALPTHHTSAWRPPMQFCASLSRFRLIAAVFWATTASHTSVDSGISPAKFRTETHSYLPSVFLFWAIVAVCCRTRANSGRTLP